MTWIDDYKRKISYENTDSFLEQYVGGESFIITDDNLKSLYSKEISQINHYSISPGEESKSLEQVNLILEHLLKENYSRNLTLIAFGGGIVCDITGFISAIYKRGCKLILMPSSVIAMVDAAIGGKNGVNSKYFKNQFGTIKQADRINVDCKLLNTLPKVEFKNGLAEVIKHGILASEEYYRKAIYLANNLPNELGNSFMADLIKESIAIKLSFVSGDEGDEGKRRILNFGHTLGHVVEKLYHLPHGKAVLWGMMKAVVLSYKLDLISKDLYNRIYSDLENLNTFDPDNLDWDTVLKALLSDKKRQAQVFNFILIEGFAKPIIKQVDLNTVKVLIVNNNE